VINSSQRTLRQIYTGNFLLEQNNAPESTTIANYPHTISNIDDATLLPFDKLFPYLEMMESVILCSSLRYLEENDQSSLESLMFWINHGRSKVSRPSVKSAGSQLSAALSRAIYFGWIEANIHSASTSAQSTPNILSPGTDLDPSFSSDNVRLDNTEFGDEKTESDGLSKLSSRLLPQPPRTANDCMEVIVVPTPLSLPTRHRIADIISNGNLKIKSIRSSAYGLSTAFLMTQQGQDILQDNLGHMRFMLLELGEEYVCASIIEINCVIAHASPAVAVAAELDLIEQPAHTSDVGKEGTLEISRIQSSDSGFQKIDRTNVLLQQERDKLETLRMECPIFPVCSMSVRLHSSEGDLHFGYRELDEQFVQDWLSVLFHLTYYNGSKASSDKVNTADGSRRWFKLPAKTRLQCVLAVYSYRKARGGASNIVEQESVWRTMGENDFYSIMCAEENEGERFVILHAFLMRQCDPILQVLTQWISNQSFSILKQLVEQYGAETIQIEALAINGKQSKTFYIASNEGQQQDDRDFEATSMTGGTAHAHDLKRKSWKNILADTIKVRA
jgi:hypothetical protein